MSEDKTVTLSSGEQIVLRPPLSGDLRGIKVLDLLQLDTASHAELLPRISPMEKGAFYRLSGADALALMSEVVGFLAPEGVDDWQSPKPSKTPTN